VDWPFVFGHVSTATGWTMHEIEQLTLWELNDLMTYWNDYPPTHVLVAAYLMGGNKARSSRLHTGATSNSKFDDLARDIAFAGGTVNKKLPEIYTQNQN